MAALRKTYCRLYCTHSGLPHVPGSTVAEQRTHMIEHMDGIRKLLLLEPRGYPCQNADYILPPKHPEAAYGFVIAERRGAKAAYAKAPRLVCPHVSSWLWYSASQNKWMVEGIHPVRVQCVADGAKPMGAAAAGAMATPARSVGFARGGAPSFSGKSKVGMGASMGVPPLEKVHAPAAQMEKVKMPALPLEKVEVTALEESTPPFMGQGPTAGAAPPSEVDAQQPSAGNAMGYERWNGGGAPGMKWARKKRRKWRNAAKEEKLEGVKEKEKDEG